MKVQDKGFVYIYSIEFGSTIKENDYALKRRAVKNISTNLETILGLNLHNGNNLFSLTYVEDNFEFLAEAEGGQHYLKFKYLKEFNLNEMGARSQDLLCVLKFLDSLVKSGLECKEFKQIGRYPKFFLPSEKMKVPKEELLEMWPGYTTQTKWCTDGIFLNIDTATKFVNSSTILEDIDYYMKEEGWTRDQVKAYYKPATEEDQRHVVITEHNSRQYQVDEVTFDKTPQNTMMTWKDKNKVEKTTNLVEYYKIHHKRDIPKTQPMFIVRKRDQDIYLPTSLCHQASLPKDFTSNAQKMRNLQECKINKPDERVERIERLLEKIKDNKVFNAWKLSIQDTFANLKGIVLHPPEVIH